jgi:hypothetical protein
MFTGSFMWGGIGAFVGTVGSAIKAANNARKGVTIGRDMDKVRRVATVSDTAVYKPLNKHIYKAVSKVSKKAADKLSMYHNKVFIRQMFLFQLYHFQLGSKVFKSFFI